jgi:hypothetical protein
MAAIVEMVKRWKVSAVKDEVAKAEANDRGTNRRFVVTNAVFSPSDLSTPWRERLLSEQRAACRFQLRRSGAIYNDDWIQRPQGFV